MDIEIVRPWEDPAWDTYVDSHPGGTVYHTSVWCAIVKESCESGCEEFDFLQGDEAYKFPWATHERSVLEIAMAGGRPLGNMALAAIRLRWRVARSERLRELRGRVLEARSRLRKS